MLSNHNQCSRGAHRHSLFRTIAVLSVCAFTMFAVTSSSATATAAKKKPAVRNVKLRTRPTSAVTTSVKRKSGKGTNNGPKTVKPNTVVPKPLDSSPPASIAPVTTRAAPVAPPTTAPITAPITAPPPPSTAKPVAVAVPVTVQQEIPQGPDDPILAAGASTTVAGPASTTTTTRLPPAPYPAPANPPTRPAAATLDPYRGLGAWVDRIDYTVKFGKPIPAVNVASIDAMAAAGIQTVYIQAAHWSTTPDVLEPERLLPMIDRAHALGMQVVLWYLPFLIDVNTDLRKVVALANLDVDGIQIDIESKSITDVALRNQRLAEFNKNVRLLLPGRVVTADILPSVWLDPAPDRWTWPEVPLRNIKPWWRGPFPFADVVANYDLLAIQTYWSENNKYSGWRDSSAFVTESVNRLRATINRPDYPIHLIGGVARQGTTATLNDMAGFIEAARAAGTFGISMYDWDSTPVSWWSTLWGFRSVVDARFVPIALPPYAPLPKPPPPTTTTTTTRPPTTTTLVPPPVSVVIVPDPNATTTLVPATLPPAPPSTPTVIVQQRK